MTTNLMDTVKGMFTSEAIGRASEQTGEPPDKTQKAMDGAVPTIFAGLTHGASTPTGAAGIFGAVTESGASGQGLMSKVFGSRGGAVSDALGKNSGMSGGAASRVLVFALPMVAGVVGKHVLSNRVNPSGLAQILAGHKKAIQEDPNTPPGLAGALGVGNLSELGSAPTNVTEPRVGSAAAPTRAVTHRAHTEQEHVGIKKHARWAFILPVVLLGALLIWGASALLRGHGNNVGVTAPQPTQPTAAPPTEAPRVETSPTPETPAAGPVSLPGGKTLAVAQDSAEGRMAHDLGDTSTSLPRTFHFDSLTFESGSTAVPPDSTKTIDALTTMLQAYPSARIRIEGHTDEAGSAAANQALAESRANAVKTALTGKGIASDRIEATAASERLAGGSDSQGNANDRRADIVLLNR